VGSVSDGIGDLVHLEEYTKYLHQKYRGQFNVISVVHLGDSDSFALRTAAKARSEKLSDVYKDLNIRVSTVSSGNQVYLDQQALIKSLLSESERASVAKTILISHSGDLQEYGSNGPYRFYKEPGTIGEANKFFLELEKQSPELHKILTQNEAVHRPFIPADIRRRHVLKAFFKNFVALQPGDFYFPKDLMKQEGTRLEIEGIAKDHNLNLLFVTPENIKDVAATPVDSHTIRIFYGFPLSDESYKGLYLYTRGDVVGYSGDDTFSLALSSGKLPFPDPHNGVQQNLILEILPKEIQDPALKHYFLKIYERHRERYLSGVRNDEGEIQFDDLPRNPEELQKLKAAWLKFAHEAYVKKNGFRTLDEMVKLSRRFK
jgi:hypothetical protein